MDRPESTPSSSKAADHAGFKAQNNMTVQPPREEDLQKSYESIVGTDANPKGWYGSMSMYCRDEYKKETRHQSLIFHHSQQPRRLHWNNGRYSLLHLLSQPV